MATTSDYIAMDMAVVIALIGTAGAMLVVLSRKQMKSVFAKGLDPPIAHLTSAAISSKMQKIGGNKMLC